MKTIKNIKAVLAIIAVVICFYKPVKGTNRVQSNNGPDSSAIMKTYYGNGHLRAETPYEQGMKNGVAKEYYENGQLKCETPYDNNVKDGIVREYYENGDIKSETTYMDGVPGMKTLYKQERKGR